MPSPGPLDPPLTYILYPISHRFLVITAYCSNYIMAFDRGCLNLTLPFLMVNPWTVDCEIWPQKPETSRYRAVHRIWQVFHHTGNHSFAAWRTARSVRKRRTWWRSIRTDDDRLLLLVYSRLVYNDGIVNHREAGCAWPAKLDGRRRCQATKRKSEDISHPSAVRCSTPYHDWRPVRSAGRLALHGRALVWSLRELTAIDNAHFVMSACLLKMKIKVQKWHKIFSVSVIILSPDKTNAYDKLYKYTLDWTDTLSNCQLWKKTGEEPVQEQLWEEHTLKRSNFIDSVAKQALYIWQCKAAEERATQEHLEKGSRKANVDGRLQKQVENDGDGNSRQSCTDEVEWSVAWPMIHWEYQGISQY